MNDTSPSEATREGSAGPFSSLSQTPQMAEEPPPQASDVGTLLCATRMRIGKDLQDVAAVLHIRYNFLVAIEDGRYEDLPGQAYAIGFVRAYADHLGLDGDEVVRRYKEETAGIKRATRYEYPIPAPESGIPSGALLLIAVVLGMVVYGVWYSMADADRRAADVIQEVPDRLAALLQSNEGTTQPSASSAASSGETTSETTQTDQIEPSVAASEEQNAPAAPVSVVAQATPDVAPPERTATASVTPASKPALALAPPMSIPVQPPSAVPQDKPAQLQVAAAPPSAKPAQPSTQSEPASSSPAQAAPPLAASPKTTASQDIASRSQTKPPQSADTPPAVTSSAASKPNTPQPEASRTVATMPVAASQVSQTPPVVTQSARNQAASVSQTPTSQNSLPQSAAQQASVPPTAPTVRPPATATPTSAPTSTPRAATSAAVPPTAPPQAAPARTIVQPTRTPTASAGRSNVELRAKSDSWIQVRDGEQLLLTRFLRKGEVYKVPERNGLTLMTLNAGGIEIMVDGEVMPPLGDPGSVARGVMLDADKLKAQAKPQPKPAAPTTSPSGPAPGPSAGN